MSLTTILQNEISLNNLKIEIDALSRVITEEKNNLKRLNSNNITSTNEEHIIRDIARAKGRIGELSNKHDGFAQEFNLLLKETIDLFQTEGWYNADRKPILKKERNNIVVINSQLEVYIEWKQKNQQETINAHKKVYEPIALITPL